MTTLTTPRSQPSHPKASLRPIVSVVLRSSLSSPDLQSDQGTRLAQATAIISRLVARLVVSSSSQLISHQSNWPTKVEGCKGLTFVLRAMRPNSERSEVLLGVPSNVYGFAKILKCRSGLRDEHRLSRFLYTLLSSFPTPRQTDKYYRMTIAPMPDSTI